MISALTCVSPSTACRSPKNSSNMTKDPQNFVKGQQEVNLSGSRKNQEISVLVAGRWLAEVMIQSYKRGWSSLLGIV